MEIIFSGVVTLFLVMDPFGNIPLFIASLKNVPQERRMLVLVRELLIAFIIMIAFLFAGTKAMSLLGIEPYSMAIAGGLTLLIISIQLVFASHEEREDNSKKKDEPFIVPLAIPLIAGPATLSMVLILAAGNHISATLAAVFIASALNAAVLLLSFPISNLLGRRGLMAIERLTGLLLILMSVNMIMGGIAQFIEVYR
jgi:multiple antibiotic resistance protein